MLSSYCLLLQHLRRDRVTHRSQKTTRKTLKLYTVGHAEGQHEARDAGVGRPTWPSVLTHTQEVVERLHLCGGDPHGGKCCSISTTAWTPRLGRVCHSKLPGASISSHHSAWPPLRVCSYLQHLPASLLTGPAAETAESSTSPQPPLCYSHSDTATVLQCVPL